MFSDVLCRWWESAFLVGQLSGHYALLDGAECENLQCYTSMDSNILLCTNVPELICMITGSL